MEPDITALSSSPVVDPDGRAPSGESGLIELAHAAESPTSMATLLAGVPVATPVTTNGHSNGHTLAPANGHGNGNGHANGHGLNGLDLLSAGAGTAAASWPALAGPVRGAVVAGGYAATDRQPATSRESLYLRFGKRLFDIVGAAFALVVSSPLMLLAAIAIRLESRGPVFYRSTRVGRGGRPFTFYKLRSMVNGADRHRQHLSHLNECDGPVFKISKDPRVTVVGRFLRTTSLDELPQFWNVLCGEMSLVGPRPPIPDEVSHYQPWQMRRLIVRPGITCLWQISGRSRIGFEEWMRLDLEYINRQSLPLDVQILLRTIPAVLSREGAY